MLTQQQYLDGASMALLVDTELLVDVSIDAVFSGSVLGQRAAHGVWCAVCSEMATGKQTK